MHIHFTCVDYCGQLAHELILEWAKIYGSVLTIWLGHKPVVVLGTI